MQKTFFPKDFLDSGEVAFLLAAQKLLLAGPLVHFRRQACGVITLTDSVISSLSFLPSVGRGVAEELDRLGLAVYDDHTREFLVLGQFAWNLTPPEAGIDSPWATNVLGSLKKIRSQKIKDAASAEIASAPSEKSPIEQVPTNLLTTLPRRASGQKWEASELLVLLCLYAADGGFAPGVLVVDFDVLGGLCSLPPETAQKACLGLAASGAIFFDESTHETLVFPRLRAATKKEIKTILAAAENLGSRRAKNALKKQFSRTSKENTEKSGNYVPEENSLSVFLREEKEKPTPAASAADNEKSNPESQTPAAELEAHIDALAEEAKKKGGNKLLDASNLLKLRALAKILPPEEMLAAIKPTAWPTDAVKACRDAKLEEKAKKIASEAIREERKGAQEVAAPDRRENPEALALVGKTLFGEGGQTVRLTRTGAKVGGKLRPLQWFAEQLGKGHWRLADGEEAA